MKALRGDGSVSRTSPKDGKKNQRTERKTGKEEG